MSRWETLDLSALLAQKTEATTSANAGAFPVPLGPPISRYPVSPQDRLSSQRRGSDDPYGGYQDYDDWLLPSKV